MSLFTYQSGDCGLGYRQSTMLLIGILLLAFLPNMILMLSWVGYGTVGDFVVPILIGNPYVIPAWVLGGLAAIPGIMVLFANSHGKRVITFNAWTVMIGLFTIGIACAGIYMVNFLATDKRITINATDEARHYLTDKIPQNLRMKKDSAASAAADRATEIAESVGAYMLYKALPYPISAIYFLHWQIGVSAFAFCVVPTLLCLWAFYHVLGNRNFFATNPEAFKDQTILEGPIVVDDSESGSESDSDSESESEESDDGETRPLSKRHKDYERNSSQATRLQSQVGSDPRRGKVVRTQRLGV